MLTLIIDFSKVNQKSQIKFSLKNFVLYQFDLSILIGLGGWKYFSISDYSIVLITIPCRTTQSRSFNFTFI